MVQTSEIMAPEDATSFIADLRAGVAAGTAMQLQRLQQEKDHAWSLEYAVLHPMARPAGHAPVKVRWSPLSRSPKSRRAFSGNHEPSMSLAMPLTANAPVETLPAGKPAMPLTAPTPAGACSHEGPPEQSPPPSQPAA